jgi:hypothetical protein
MTGIITAICIKRNECEVYVGSLLSEPRIKIGRAFKEQSNGKWTLLLDGNEIPSVIKREPTPNSFTAKLLIALEEANKRG